MGPKHSGIRILIGLLLGYIIVMMGLLTFFSFRKVLGHVFMKTPSPMEDGTSMEEKIFMEEELSMEEKISMEEGGSGREDLELASLEVYRYDEAGNCTAVRCYDETGEVIETRDSVYDGEGRLVSEDTLFSFGGGHYTDIYRYDDQGRKIYYSYATGDQEPPSETYYSYRELGEGITIQLGQGYSGGEPGSYTGWITNAAGDRVSYCRYDEEGQLTSYHFRKYDEQGRPVYWRQVNGGLDCEPLREAYLYWNDEEDTCTVTVYEPPGHVNELEYISYTENGDITRDLLYLSGYSGYDDNTPYILGQEGKYQQGTMGFWEGQWAAYQGEDELWEMGMDHKELQYYKAYRYEEGRVKEELACETDGFFSLRYRYYEYDEEGRLLKKYEYRICTESFTLGLADGSTVEWKIQEKESGVKRLREVTHTSGDGEILEHFVFDQEEKLTKQYTKEWGDLWPETPPVDLGEIFTGWEVVD